MCQLVRTHQPIQANQLNPVLQTLVPPHPVAQEAFEIAKSSLSLPIFYHSLRVFIYAKAFTKEYASWNNTTGTGGARSGREEGISSIQPITVEPHVLFVACMFHDLGTIEKYDLSPERFEITGADEAVTLLRKHLDDGGRSELSIREAWLAMALHTSPGISDRIGGTVGAFRRGIMVEFGGVEIPLQGMEEHECALFISHDDNNSSSSSNETSVLPRLDIEKELSDAVVFQALITRSKAPLASWAGVMLQAHLGDPNWEGVNKAF